MSTDEAEREQSEAEKAINWLLDDERSEYAGCTHAARVLAAALDAQRAPRGEAQEDKTPDAERVYAGLHSLSKEMEGSGIIDEHTRPDAYGIILDAMAFVMQARRAIRRGEENA